MENGAFGVVSLSGSNVMVGAPWQVIDGSNWGEAYVFGISGAAPCTPPPDAGTDAGPAELDAGALDDGGACAPDWTELADFPEYDTGGWDPLGGAVALDGDTAVVVGANAGGLEASAYVFAGSGTTWTQQAELTASNGTSGDLFGLAVAVSGDTVIVGAPGSWPGASPPGGTVVGAVYVFVRNGDAWTEEAKLTASNGAPGDAFGAALSMSGDLAIIGAPNHTASGKAGAGAVYVFARSGTTWTQEAELTASDGTVGADFGAGVSVNGGTILVGAPGSMVEPSGAPGAAYVFTRSGTTWTQEAEILGQGSGFGYAVSLSGDMAVVSAPFINVGSVEWAGMVYVYTRSGATWTLETQLFALDGEVADNIGTFLSLSGGTVLAGVRPGPTAKAYVFARSGGAWVQEAEIRMPLPTPGLTNMLQGLSLSGSTAFLGGGSGGFVFEDVGCTPVPDAGPPDAGPPDAGDGTGDAFGGCGCRAAADDAGDTWPGALVLVLALAWRRRPGSAAPCALARRGTGRRARWVSAR